MLEIKPKEKNDTGEDATVPESDGSVPADADIDAFVVIPAPDAPPMSGPANDLPAGAIDVSGGGTFAWDPTYAIDNVASSCASAAGPDVFFQITLAASEVIYLETFGSSADSVLAIRTGACASNGSEQACVDNSCSTLQSHGAWSLSAGTHCIVVDQVGSSGGTAAKLRVTRGNRAGDPLNGTGGTVSGNTCLDDNSNLGCDSSDGEPAKDHHYFVAVCPGTRTLQLSTCGGASWDTVLEVRRNSGTSIECRDDQCGTNNRQTSLSQSVTGPALYWAIIDGYDACGSYTMTYSL